MKTMIDATLLAKLPQPIDIAQIALYLASEDSAMVTGAVFTVDGGMSAGPIMMK